LPSVGVKDRKDEQIRNLENQVEHCEKLDALGINCDEIGGARNVNRFFTALISNWEAFYFLL
jgi:hypothetical protein